MHESTLAVGGAVVFWTAAPATDRTKLFHALDRLGLAHLVPDPRPPSAVLRDALEEVLGGPRTLVRPLADRDGFAVVREDRGKSQNHYAPTLTARVQDSDPPVLTFDPFDARAYRIEHAFDKHRGRIPASQLSACLVKAVEHLGGTRLRPTGAVYWVPGPKLDEWTQIARAVESAAEGRASAVYLLRHRMDADAVRAIRDAVVGEVQADAERIRSEVTSGELGGKAVETRQQQAQDLRAKVLLYEHLLSVGLDGLHATLDAADQAAATAALLLGSQPSTTPNAHPNGMLAAR